MRVRREVDTDFWWSVATRCSYATFFHTPLWSELFRRTYPSIGDATVGAELPSGTRVVLPLMARHRAPNGLVRDLASSSFAGTYGGLIADGEFTAREASALFEAVSGWTVRKLQIHGNPIAPADTLPSRGKRESDFTHILLLNKPYATLLANFSKGHRSQVTQGTRKGVTVRVASNLAEYRAYYGAYEDSLRRWGEGATSEYPWTLFEHGCALAAENPHNIKLWIAEADGEIIAGAWVFYWNRHVAWWHGAAYEAYFDHRPNNVLQAEIIKDAVDRGYLYYDFNPSGGHEGVAHFKRRFGALQWPFQRSRHTSQVWQTFWYGPRRVFGRVRR